MADPGIECPACGTMNPPDAIVCEQCGADLLDPNEGDTMTNRMRRSHNLSMYRYAGRRNAPAPGTGVRVASNPSRISRSQEQFDAADAYGDADAALRVAQGRSIAMIEATMLGDD
jgi:hypothetical protein